jgi:pyruvate formate lyase activating enzyme
VTVSGTLPCSAAFQIDKAEKALHGKTNILIDGTVARGHNVNMLTGIVFDLREFTIHDGPGLRTTVFMKGCPLRCSWCHNPEGILPDPQWLHSSTGSRRVGVEYSSAQLAKRLNDQSAVLQEAGGGVTFSGGEPLFQAVFVAEVIDQLDGLHVVLDTSGFANREAFRLVAGRVQLVYFDLKLIDAASHRAFTGQDNACIHENLTWLAAMDVPCVIRAPMIPGVTDTEENLAAMGRLVRQFSNVERVDLLPYNRAAGGKYAAAGMVFQPGFDENRPVFDGAAMLQSLGLRAAVV